jgi:hypothetical protein
MRLTRIFLFIKIKIQTIMTARSINNLRPIANRAELFAD